MKRGIKRILILLCILLPFCMAVCAESMPGAFEYRVIHEMAKYIADNYKFGIDENTLIDAALYTKLTNPEGGFEAVAADMMNRLDEHSSYMTAETWKTFMEHSIAGSFAGIGVNISITTKEYVIVSTIPGSPAEAAGIMPGDILVSVDDVNVEGMEFTALRNKISGTIGTMVTVGVKRGASVLHFTVQRQQIEENIVRHEVRDNVGYIKMTNFALTAVPEVEKALEEFSALGIKDIIIDLRDNPGGDLNVALAMCRFFTPKGVIMRIEYAQNKNHELMYNEKDASGKYNLAVLVNEGSASASELFAGTIQDTNSGEIIGTKTFGKGTMQEIRKILTGGAMRLTIAEYKTASGRGVHHVGITPDRVVENTWSVRDTSYMKNMELTKTIKEGDSGEGVLALEQRLAFWGYMENADETADAETTKALRVFQARSSLPVTGEADIYTQMRLNDADYEVRFENDDQLAAAMEYFHAGR